MKKSTKKQQWELSDDALLNVTGNDSSMHNIFDYSNLFNCERLSKEKACEAHVQCGWGMNGELDKYGAPDYSCFKIEKSII
jgi:hypothetical protein